MYASYPVVSTPVIHIKVSSVTDAEMIKSATCETVEAPVWVSN